MKLQILFITIVYYEYDEKNTNVYKKLHINIYLKYENTII